MLNQSIKLSRRDSRLCLPGFSSHSFFILRPKQFRSRSSAESVRTFVNMASNFQITSASGTGNRKDSGPWITDESPATMSSTTSTDTRMYGSCGCSSGGCGGHIVCHDCFEEFMRDPGFSTIMASPIRPVPLPALPSAQVPVAVPAPAPAPAPAPTTSAVNANGSNGLIQNHFHGPSTSLVFNLQAPGYYSLDVNCNGAPGGMSASTRNGFLNGADGRRAGGSEGVMNWLANQS